MKRIAVYCGAATGNDQAYQTATVTLAHYLAGHDLELVYGGGGVGLMGLLANEVLNAGVQCKALCQKNSINVVLHSLD